MVARYFHRRVLLVLPFLFIFCFPAVTWCGVQLLGWQVDWDHGLVGFRTKDKPHLLRLDWTNWWNGDFQKNFTVWWDHNCPGHFFFIRLFAQVDYTCLSSSCMMQNRMIVGPGGELNDLESTLDAKHQQSLTPEHLAALIGKLKNLQAQLRQQGKAFLIVTTPDKPVTSPETMPARFSGYESVGPRPYEQLIAALANTGIPYVDGAGIVHQAAYESKYPLFTQGGFHWSRYAAMQVLPEIADKISQLTGKPLLPPTIAKVDMIKATHSRDQGDHDLATLLNLLSRPLGFTTPSLTLNFAPHDPDVEPRVVFAGGSFCWNLLSLLEDWWQPTYVRHIPFASYSRDFFDTGDFPMQRGTFESLLASSDILVLEILEEVPETTIDGLPSIIAESAKAPVNSTWDIAFDENGNSAHFTSTGFSRQEPAYRWSNGNDAILHVALPPKTATYTVALKVRPYLSKTQSHQRVQVFADETLCCDADLTRDEVTTLNFTFPASYLLRLRFHFCNDVPAPELTTAEDDGTRQLGVAFYSMRIEPVARP